MMNKKQNTIQSKLYLLKGIKGEVKIIVLLLSLMTSFSSFSQKAPIEVDTPKVPETIVEVEDGHKIEIQTSAICEMCKKTLEYDLAFEKGVKEAVLNLDDKVLSITYNPKRTDPKKLRERITKVGYHADWMERDSSAYKKLPFCCKDGSHSTPVPQVPTKKKGNN